MTPLKKLKDISSYCTDKILKSEITSNEYISTTNMLADMKGIELAASLPPSLKLNRYESKDILIANIRPYFKKIWQADKTGGCDADVLNIRANKNEILPEFLYYSLFRKEFFDYIMVGSKGVKMPRGDKDFIMNFEVQVPSFQKQEETVSKIKPFFEKIESNNILISNFEDYTQLLFHKWFVDFNFPDENGNPYKDSGGEMVEVDGKKIPKGWNIKTIADMSKSVVCGKTPSTKIENNFGVDVPFITIPDMHGKVFINHTQRYLSDKGAKSQKSKLLPKGTICVSCIASPGLVVRTAQISQTNQQINSVIPLFPEYENYLYLVLKKFGKNIEKLAGGSIAKNMNTGQFSNLRFIEPDIFIVNSFNKVVDSMFLKLLYLERENDLLSETRDLLIKKLIK